MRLHEHSDAYSTVAELMLLNAVLNGGRWNLKPLTDAEKIAWLRFNLPRTYAYLAAHRNWHLLSEEVA